MSGTFQIARATPPVPSAPTLESKTPNSVTLVAMEGYQYRRDSRPGQSDNVFTGLVAGTTYSFSLRRLQSENYNISVWGEALEVTTYVSLCDICGEYDCEKTHEKCDVCEEWDCDKEHEKCDICGEWDCTENHETNTLAPHTSHPEPLRTWIQNNILHIEGLTIGQTYRIYTVSGTLVYQGIATENPMQILLPRRGTYIIHSENKSTKIIW
jgi:hypothetical protein